jgi:hypothetical protein
MGTIAGRSHFGLVELLEHDAPMIKCLLPRLRVQSRTVGMATQWSQTFALFFIGVFLLLAFFEVGGAGSSLSCVDCVMRRRAATRTHSRTRHTDIDWITRVRGRPSCRTLWGSTAPGTRAVRGTCGRIRCGRCRRIERLAVERKRVSRHGFEHGSVDTPLRACPRHVHACAAARDVCTLRQRHSFTCGCVCVCVRAYFCVGVGVRRGS